MRIDSEIKLDFKDVLIRPKRSTLGSRAEVNLSRDFTFKYSKQKWNGVPIIAANMDGVGTFKMATELAKHEMMTALVKHYDLAEFNTNGYREKYTFICLGISDDDYKKFKDITNIHGPQFICIVFLNSYSENFIDFVKKVRNDYPKPVIMAGNVVTADVTEQLILAGADIVKVGIGSGSVCTTRKVTGVGFPQLSAVIECADAAHGLGGKICSDGGCTVPGDIAKAFGAGADFVMLGSMLAGHEESGLKIIEKQDEITVVSTSGPSETFTPAPTITVPFYGMSSKKAMEKHSGGVANYRSSEGRYLRIEYKGPVKETIKHILGGLRSACTYVGARSLRELSRRTTFIIVNQQLNTVYG